VKSAHRSDPAKNEEILMPRIRILLVAAIAILALAVAGAQASATALKGTSPAMSALASTITLTQKARR